MICDYRGLDVNKRVNGRKREFVVDTDGRLWVVDVHGTNEAEGPAAVPLVSTILWRAGERLEKVYGDQAYNGVFAQALAAWSIDFEKASRPESARGFVPVAKRWVVERSIAWTNRTGDPVLPAYRQRLRVHVIFFGELAVSSQHSDHATTNLTAWPNLIPQHVLS
ncbi:hypothetical protein [Spirosoma luteum]|uniref:hypothetical protein n=1 Tax=Spirosoma luteum TaxID=431553 RepID=UPI00316ADA49